LGFIFLKAVVYKIFVGLELDVIFLY